VGEEGGGKKERRTEHLFCIIEIEETQLKSEVSLNSKRGNECNESNSNGGRGGGKAVR